MKLIAETSCLCLFFLGMNFTWAYGQSNSKEFFVYVSNSAKDAEAGILIYTFNAADGLLKPLAQNKELKNTDYLNISPNQKYLYAVGNHKDGEYLSAFETNPQTGLLTLINQKKIAGRDACYVAVDKQNQYVLVANYSSGNAFSYKINPNGSVEEAASEVIHKGKSINPERQNEPHPHMILPAPFGNIVVIPDLGMDKVMIYQLNSDTGKLNPSGNLFGQLPAGGGPRHLAFHPKGKFAYCLNELANTITAFQYNKKDGSLKAIQTSIALPQDHKSVSYAADIHISLNEKYVYSSNRGHNSIAVSEINSKTGLLTFKGTFPCGGDTPRAFGIDPTGNFILVANLKSHTIAVFKINHQTGFADKIGEVSAQSPQCVKFLAKKP